MLRLPCRMPRMRKFRFLTRFGAITMTLAVCAFVSRAQQPTSVTPNSMLDSFIQAKIAAWHTAGNTGDVYIYAKNLDTGTDYAFNADTPTPTASTIKLPVMIEAFYLAQDGKLDWKKKLTLADNDKISGSGILQDLSSGDQLPVWDILRLMIELSDNSGTNLVLSQVDGNAVNARMASLGLQHTALMRGILNNHTLPTGPADNTGKPAPFGQTAEGAKPENAPFGIGRSCPRDMVILLEKLYRGQLVSKEASDKMLDVMKHQFYHYAGRDLPDDVIASKSGGLDHFRSDVALIYSPHGAIAMTITVNGIAKPNYSNSNPGAALINDLSEILRTGLATTSTK
jgi:beta-lactamase class A